MPEARKRPCTICRRWFRPDPRVGERQRACDRPECQTARRRKTQASWRRRSPDYAIAWRLDRRQVQAEAVEPLRLPPPLPRLPWDLAKDQFGAQGADFLGVMGALILRAAKDQFRPYPIDPAGLPSRLPPAREKTSSRLPHTGSRTAADATGVSSTGAPVGAAAGGEPAAPAPAVGLAG
jgi:hypothetical protein